MALYFITDTPDKLLTDYKKAIDDGKVDTWSYDKDGDFTHTPTQWKNLAWLRPKIEAGKLAVFILKPQDKKISAEVYAVYHGRFIESMVRHCDKLFSRGIATSMPEGSDQVG